MIAILVGILVAGFLVRMAALTYGLPLDLFGDEFVHIVTAFSLLDEMTLRALSPLSYVPSLLGLLITPFTVLWGGLLMLTGAVDGVAGFKEYATLNAIWFIPIGRAISALFGALFLYILFLITRHVTTTKVALTVTALASLDFWLVHESQLAHFWMPGLTLIAAGFYFLLRLAESGMARHYALSVGSIALGFWMGYFPVILSPFLVLAHAHVRMRKFKNILYATLSLVSFFAIIGWLNPLSFLKQFGRAIRSGLDVVGVDVFSNFQAPADVATEPIRNLLFLLKVVALDNPFIFALGICGFVIVVWRLGWRAFPAQFTIGLFFTYLLAGMFVWSHPDHRYALPLLLPLYIGVAYSIHFLLENMRGGPRIQFAAYACIAALCLYPAYTTFTYVALLRQKDTRIEAREWIFENVPENSAVLMDAYYFDLPKSGGAIEYLEKYVPEALRSRDRIIAKLAVEDIQKPGYLAVNTEYAQKLAALGKLPAFSYVVAGFFDPTQRPTLPSGYTQVVSFYPRDFAESIDDALGGPDNPAKSVYSVSRLGPYVEIYKKDE